MLLINCNGSSHSGMLYTLYSLDVPVVQKVSRVDRVTVDSIRTW